MENLPMLPGYIFANCDILSKDYKLKQKLKFLNGFRVIDHNFDADNILQNVKFVEYNPKLTYGCSKNIKYEYQSFVPHYVLYNQQCLRFEAYFKQGIFGSPNEYYRVRYVNIFYYLEDDTMAVIEPHLKNVGFSQGKLVKRSKIPKFEKQTFYHWKDLNVGIDIVIHGVIYHIVGCDQFSRKFLTSQGIDVSEPESIPPDPYMQNREMKILMEYLPGVSSNKENRLAEDQRYRFLEFDRMVLSFEAIWNENHFNIRYYLADNTIAVSILRRPNEDKNMYCGLLLKKTKVPKNWKDIPSTYPGIYAEKNDEDVSQYYSPIDLKVGETIFIFGRRFLLYDCDTFTRKYYFDMLKIEQPPRMTFPQESSSLQKATTFVEHKANNKDSSQDTIRKLYHFPKKLRYSLSIDVVHPEDEGRKFVLEYSLSDGMIRINEFAQRNLGRRTGCFLNWIHVPKPDDTDYYAPNDFYIGDKINIFGHWFIITGTELFVYKYILANPQKFHEKVQENIKEYMKLQGLIDEHDDCNKVAPDVHKEDKKLKDHLDDTYHTTNKEN